MNRKLLCYGPFCHPNRIKHDRSELISYKRKHYCKKCWHYLKAQRHDRFALYRYIERKAMIHYPTGMMMRDIKNYRKTYHYTYSGIQTALMFADKHSLNFDFRSPYFLHYVPYIYEKAQRWQYNQDRHNNMMLNHDDHPNDEVQHVTVRAKVFRPKKVLPKYDMSKF